MTDQYTYRVIWSAEDQEHVGLCEEFPSLSWLAESPELALAGIRELVHGVLDDMKATGERPPEPRGELRVWRQVRGGVAGDSSLAGDRRRPTASA